MIPNPLAVLMRDVTAHFARKGIADIRTFPSLHSDARWRPHLYDRESHRAWHLLTIVPDTGHWVERIQQTLGVLPDLKLGIAGPRDVLQSAEVLDAADQLNAQVIVAAESDGKYQVSSQHESVVEYVCENELQLEIELARKLLDRHLDRVLTEANSKRKGDLLEFTAALLFSQVRGFRVITNGIRRLNQQMDLAIVNSNVGGLLGGSPLVLGEAKNWANPVGPTEYLWLLRKMQTSNGRAKLGFFITTDRYTRGGYIEAVRDTSGDYLIVMLDEYSFPAVWRQFASITTGIENMVLKALQDQQQRAPEGR